MAEVYSYSIHIDAKRDIDYVVIGMDSNGNRRNDIAAFKDDIVVNGNVVQSSQGVALVDDIEDMREATDFTAIPSARLITPTNHNPLYLYVYDLNDAELNKDYTYSTQWMFCSDEHKTESFDAATGGFDYSLFFETDDTHELIDFSTRTPLRHPTYMRFDSYCWDIDKVMDRLGIVLSRNDDGDMCYSMDMPMPAATSGTMRASMTAPSNQNDNIIGDRINEVLEVCYLFEQANYQRLYNEHGSMAVVNPMSTDVADILCISDCTL